MLQAPAAGAHVPSHELAVFRVVLLGQWLEDVRGHHGREHARHDERGEHGQRRRPAELLEEFTDDAAHESRGQKYGNQCEGDGNHRHANLIGGLHRGLVRGLAHAQVAHDVLDLYNRVIDQNADHQTECQQRHHVDGKTQVVHANKSRNHGQRQRYC